MQLTASPLFSRQSSRVVPASPGARPTQQHRRYDSDDSDELADDRIISQSPYFTQPTQIVNRNNQRATQPTQILGRNSQRATQPTQIINRNSQRATQPTQIIDRTTLKPQPSPTPFSSSPASIIEVPASSPFQPRPSPTRLPFQPKPSPNRSRIASLMAPAGTKFRPPPRPTPAKTIPAKREVVCLDDSDDEFDVRPTTRHSSDDDDAPMRGAIRPSSFTRQEPQTDRTRPADSPPPQKKQKTEDDVEVPTTATDARQTLAARRFGHKVRKLMSLVGKRCSEKSAREALRATNEDVQAARDQLTRRKSSPSPPSTPSPAVTPLPKMKPKGRLVRGIRPQRSRASSPSFETPLETTKNKAMDKIIDLVSDGEDDDFVQNDASSASASASQASPASEHDPTSREARLLNYLNTCTAEQLISMCKINKVSAETMVSRRPYRSLDAAESVTILKAKTSRSKPKRIRVGEDVVEALGDYIKTLEAIEQVISACDKKGTYIKSIIERWNVDQTGKKPTEGQPMTPRSADSGSSQLVDLPIAGEPGYLRGHCDLKSYQLYGMNWMDILYKQRFGCILADDMGLGKTCQVISFLAHIVEEYESQEEPVAARPWPNLVVVPPTTLSNWENEFEKFAPGLKITSYRGSQVERDDLLQDILDNPEDHHVVLTSYTQLGRAQDIVAMRQIGPNVAVFDEGHKLKNPKTKVYKDLCRIPAKWKLLLTGTPIQNNIMEMITLLGFIQPKLFGAHMDKLQALFDQRISLRNVTGEAFLFADRVSRARTILEPFILQRRKQQVLSSLPKKTARVVYCGLSKPQKPIYEAYENRFRHGKDAEEPKPVKTGRQSDQNNVWVQLRKSACHSQLFRRYFSDETVEKMAKTLLKKVSQKELLQTNLTHLTNELKELSDFGLHLWCRDYPCLAKYDVPEDSWMESGKVEELLKLVSEFQENGDRALVFTRFAKVIDILSEVMSSAGVNYRVLQGLTDVPGRQELIDEFNEDPSITVFLLTTGAGGTGINLTAANKVIIFDQSDNPQDDIQAENRAHRLGQTREVEVIRLISKKTIEELIYVACSKKIELANQVTGWSDDGEDTENTAKEVEKEVHRMLLDKKPDAVTPPKSDNDVD